MPHTLAVRSFSQLKMDVGHPKHVLQESCNKTTLPTDMYKTKTLTVLDLNMSWG